MSVKLKDILKNKNPIYWLGFFLLFSFCALQCFAGNKDSVENKLTVMRVSHTANKAYTEVTFSESQRFYKLLKKGKQYTMFLELLKWSAKKHVPVIIQRRSEYSDTILKVSKSKQQKGFTR